jgi:diguanylate cyclase (GGDEF)-like protein/PAS domain S-box-containing protein
MPPPDRGTESPASSSADHAAREEPDSEFLAAIVDSSSDAIVGFTLDGSIASWNAGAERMYGYTRRHALGNDSAMLVPDDRRHELPAKLSAIAAGERVEQYETRVLCRDGRALEVSISLSPVLDDRGRVIGASWIARDITVQKATEQQLSHQALHDPLTDLPNRNLTRDRLRLALAHVERTGDSVGVLFLDLDNFKDVNDSAGHGVGDQILRMIAERLVHAVRPDDTVGRVGGDEFVVVCPDIHDEDEAGTVAGRINAAFERPFQLDDVRFDMKLSIGVILGSAHDSADELLRKADASMYREKELRKAGRSRG